MNSTDDISIQKKQIRELIKQRKLQQSQSQRMEQSAAVLHKLENLEVFKRSTLLFAYWSMHDEIFTHDFIEKWHPHKKIVLPCTVGNEMVLKTFWGKENMVLNKQFGIYEPDSPIFTDIDSIHLALVPGVAFDASNNRLGRGKAFYDKFLVKTNAYKIGLCFDFQYLEKVPVDSNDIKMDIIIHP